MSIERLPFERRPRNSIANNLDRINELVDWVNLDTHLYASASGERVTVDDASSVKGLTVDGRSVQDGTPTPDAPVAVQVVEGRNIVDFAHPAAVNTDGGVTFTINADGSYDIHGTATKNTYIYVTNNSSGFQLPAGRYVFSARNQDGSYPSVLRVGASRWLDGTNTSYSSASDHALTFNHDGQGNVQLIIYINNGGTVDATVYPQLEAGTTATPYVPYGSIGIVVGDTATSIDLQGNTLASLPDGTRDELHIDSTGRVWIEKRVGKYVFDGTQSVGGTTGTAAYYTISTIIDIVSPPQLAPSSSSPHAGGYPGWCNKYAVNENYIASNPVDNTVIISSRRFSSTNRIAFYDSTHTSDNATWIAYVSANPITLYYPYSEPQYIDLGYIAPPAIPSGSVVTISASLTPTFHLEWWVDDGITALVDDLITYVDYKTEG
jgi:hypothetical protein